MRPEARLAWEPHERVGKEDGGTTRFPGLRSPPTAQGAEVEPRSRGTFRGQTGTAVLSSCEDTEGAGAPGCGREPEVSLGSGDV